MDTLLLELVESELDPHVPVGELVFKTYQHSFFVHHVFESNNV
jgi:hypothetical protein